MEYADAKAGIKRDDFIGNGIKIVVEAFQTVAGAAIKSLYRVIFCICAALAKAFC